MTDGLILHPDNKTRCWWPGTDPLYVTYHDTEWGVPEFDDRALFEKLILDGFQAGLSWITILRKRDNFRKAFVGFAPEKIARFNPTKVEALMLDTGIVRNRAKIEATIAGSRAWLAIQERGGFSDFLWDFIDGRPIQNNLKHRGQIQPETDISRKISKALKAEGFNFVGPTIVYAFMQAVGMVNDHLTGCYRHAECAALAEKL
ncbi:DNA-3-methyladenine glycosylase I [Microvirga terricola]|uniref:DNA-3-methyladenine glycosylase I n=1 Tax=Microvirga terricola TaxID=2719797 RepID=A0ABX0VEJ6_9HYPH|nr:DNA-3-methyladenine glycosylase I [Microvirga terricola]NIX76771.1 DNA-3-methyladenine glycosylase I [Microvirga terricola]